MDILGKSLKAGTNINTPVLVPQVHWCLFWKNVIFLNLTLLAYSLIVREAHKQWCQTHTEAGNRQRHYKLFENNISSARFLTLALHSFEKESLGKKERLLGLGILIPYLWQLKTAEKPKTAQLLPP